MNKILLAGASLIALTLQAAAADIPPAPVAEQAVVEPDDWSGFFAGIQGGYAWGELDYFFTEPGGMSAIEAGQADGSLDLEGAAGGLFYGRNWQFDQWVLGLEGSVSVADIGDDLFVETDVDPIEGEITLDLFTTTRAKVGYAFDNIMVFAAGGLTVGHFEAELTNEFVGEDDVWALGWTVGAGVEAKLTDNWSARVEYLYLSYGEETLFEDEAAEVDIDSDVHLVRGGIAYHF